MSKMRDDDIAAIKAALPRQYGETYSRWYQRQMDTLTPDRIARIVEHVERLEKCLEEIIADFGDCRLSDRCSTALGGKE